VVSSSAAWGWLDVAFLPAVHAGFNHSTCFVLPAVRYYFYLLRPLQDCVTLNVPHAGRSLSPVCANLFFCRGVEILYKLPAPLLSLSPAPLFRVLYTLRGFTLTGVIARRLKADTAIFILVIPVKTVNNRWNSPECISTRPFRRFSVTKF
jgi:hypothetical protein